MTFEEWGKDLEKWDREFAYLDINIMYKDWKAERGKLIETLESMVREHSCKWYIEEDGEGNCFTNQEENPCAYCKACAVLAEVKGKK